MGLGKGQWLIKDINGLVRMDRYYRNDTIAKGTDYRYFDNGTPKAKLNWINNEYENYSEYDMDGNIFIRRKSPFND